jgi:hypothetical protein
VLFEATYGIEVSPRLPENDGYLNSIVELDQPTNDPSRHINILYFNLRGSGRTHPDDKSADWPEHAIGCSVHTQAIAHTGAPPSPVSDIRAVLLPAMQ